MPRAYRTPRGIDDVKDLVPATVPIVGHPSEVAMVLRTQQKLGRLLHDDIATVPMQQISNGRVIARPQMMVDRPPRRRRKADDPWRAIMAALAFVSILGVLGLAVIVAILMIPGLKTLVLSVIVVASLVAVALAMRSSTKDCPGVTTHCPPSHHK
jgi:hypothetical protein